MQYPISLIQYSLNTYKWPRRVSLDGLVTDQIFAGRGILAGAAAATYEARMFATPAVDLWRQGTTEEQLPDV
eukprot:6755490-Pyramimonas_sp.AAC.1